MNPEKKVVILKGAVQFPLEIGARAVIRHTGGPTWTSAVKVIRQVAEDLIVFETQNSTYCVTSRSAPEPTAISVKMYACA